MKLVCLPLLVFVAGLSDGQIFENPLGAKDDTPSKDSSCRNFPFMASVTDNGYLFGSAVILNENWVLTAAIVVYENIDKLLIRVGSKLYNQGGQVRKIAKRITHENWTGFDYDVAVLKVSEPFKFGKKVKHITLGREDLKCETKAHTVGWTVVDELGRPNSIQLNNNVTVLSWETCKEPYQSVLTKRMMCAIDNKTGVELTNRGDPLLVGNTVYGLYVGGFPGNASLYADVPNLYKWIQDAIKRG